MNQTATAAELLKLMSITKLELIGGSASTPLRGERSGLGQQDELKITLVNARAVMTTSPTQSRFAAIVMPTVAHAASMPALRCHLRFFGARG
ncbi:hypothetical protein [Bradyrhizobium sp. AUGA SZCCT0160]|uniref:hypothetical protein n=1 Tax=Bradyrhizobium sp. AUGA SZCCT0160 TaxID=2807662 RepID=UPI001BA4683A|nr:hypothetical protein [Bradyrhizobium sp. AUGA SZCCT0160]MBR1187295.1 hypothetical protein [Bradyrhizobium sp. AUGA SZCCT0160]